MGKLRHRGTQPVVTLCLWQSQGSGSDSCRCTCSLPGIPPPQPGCPLDSIRPPRLGSLSLHDQLRAWVQSGRCKARGAGRRAADPLLALKMARPLPMLLGSFELSLCPGGVMAHRRRSLNDGAEAGREAWQGQSQDLVPSPHLPCVAEESTVQ